MRPWPSATPSESIAFLEAAARGCTIYESADAPQTGALARGLGTTTERLVVLAEELRIDLAGGYAGLKVSPKARDLMVTTDVLLIGMLIGRELPRP